jgi:ComF family protein
MNFLNKLFFRTKNIIFPQVCALCDIELINAKEIQYSLCEQCGDSLKINSGVKCNICGKPLISEREMCLSCRNGEEHSYDRLWTLFPYTGKFRSLLSAYKFQKRLSLANFFAEKVIEIIKTEPLLKEAYIVPVPPRPGKIKESGWDQVDYLIKMIKKLEKENVRVNLCLKRGKSMVQKRLNRKERAENLKGRIYLNKAVQKTVLIIDDVITTGSTMEICANTLKEGGAEKVYGLCLFYD